MQILAFFTKNNVPATGLSPTIRIREIPGGALVVTDAAMTEVGDGHYSYDFATYDYEKDYAIRCDGGATLSYSERYTYGGNENYVDDIDSTISNNTTVLGISASIEEINTNILGVSAAVDPSVIAYTVWSAPLSAYGGMGTASGTLQCMFYDNRVYYDSNSSYSGTSFPMGTARYPVNNLADALTIINNRDIDILKLRSNLTTGPGDNISGLSIETDGLMDTTVTLTAGTSANKTAFRYVNLTGELTGSDELLVENCTIIGTLSNFDGVMNNVAFGDGGAAELEINSWLVLILGTAGGEPGSEVEFNIGDASVNISHWTGNISLKNKTGNNRTVLNCDSGNIIIKSDCVDGTIQLLGVGSIEQDNSGAGCNVDAEGFITNEIIADFVWDEPLGDHNSAGSTGRKLNEIGASIIIAGTALGNGNGYNQIELDANASTNDGAYDPAQISIINGTGLGQTRGIYQYDGATRTATVDRNWKIQPDITSEYIISSWPGREHVNEGLAQGGTSNTITLNTYASSADNAYQYQVVFIRSGRGEDQVRLVTEYNGATKTATLENPWDIIPDTTTGYVMLPYHVHGLPNIASAVWNKLVSDPTSAGSYGELVTTISNDIKRLLGLTHENIFIDQPVYDADGNLTSARVRIYSDAASVGTASNVIGTYTITAPSNAPGQFTSWKQVKI